jgi:hypothetical protein
MLKAVLPAGVAAEAIGASWEIASCADGRRRRMLEAVLPDGTVVEASWENGRSRPVMEGRSPTAQTSRLPTGYDGHVSTDQVKQGVGRWGGEKESR